MRLWTVHPKYLDQSGLVALWREALLAQKVLQNNTKGYQNHPQLIRFKTTDNPLGAIGRYLQEIYQESLRRGYHFDKSKINKNRVPSKIAVRRGQIEYEFEHLKQKLKKRDGIAYQNIKATSTPEPNPVFHIIEGGIENWEVVHGVKT
jgi:hypothetical protein